jgi:hypothetical protein
MANQSYSARTRVLSLFHSNNPGRIGCHAIAGVTRSLGLPGLRDEPA